MHASLNFDTYVKMFARKNVTIKHATGNDAYMSPKFIYKVCKDDYACKSV